MSIARVASKMGAFTGPRVHLLRLAPGTENWPNVNAWLSHTTRFEPNFGAGQASIGAAERAKRVSRAFEHLGNYDAEELVERTLKPQDGVTKL